MFSNGDITNPKNISYWTIGARVSGDNILKTPQTEGYTKQQTVSNSTLVYFKNNIVEQKYRYESVIEKSITNYPSDSTNVLVFKDYSTGLRTNYVGFVQNDLARMNELLNIPKNATAYCGLCIGYSDDEGEKNVRINQNGFVMENAYNNEHAKSAVKEYVEADPEHTKMLAKIYSSKTISKVHPELVKKGFFSK
jgi:hypothetical protein